MMQSPPISTPPKKRGRPPGTMSATAAKKKKEAMAAVTAARLAKEASKARVGLDERRESRIREVRGPEGKIVTIDPETTS